MKVENHKLIAEGNDFEISFEESPNKSGVLGNNLPDTIIIHYTAGASLGSSVAWLRNPAASASAHLVIGKDGKIVQLVEFNTKAWHAGKSQWNGRIGLNSYSIGIEIDNAGVLTKRANGYCTSTGKKIDDDNVVLAAHKHQSEIKAWEAYTQKQIETVEQICIVLKEQYNIKEIVGHEDISPGRKIDPGPAYPLQQLRERVLFGRNEEGSSVSSIQPGLSIGTVTADYLNIRTNSAPNAPIVTDPLPRGTKVIVEKQEGDWFYVKVDLEGWVSRKWVDLIS